MMNIDLYRRICQCVSTDLEKDWFRLEMTHYPTVFCAKEQFVLFVSRFNKLYNYKISVGEAYALCCYRVRCVHAMSKTEVVSGT